MERTYHRPLSNLNFKGLLSGVASTVPGLFERYVIVVPGQPHVGCYREICPIGRETVRLMQKPGDSR